MNEFKFIKVSEGDTTVITFNRPDCFNAMNVSMKFEIIKAIKAANKTAKTIILTGEGKAFCSGQDLNDRTMNAENGPIDLGVTIEKEWNPLITAIQKSAIPVIGAINGVAAGAGLSVALSCDLIVSIPENKFVSGFSAIGLCPDAGSSHLFARTIGYSKAFEFFLMNKPLLAEQMLEFHLINEIAEDPISRAQEMSEHLNALPPLSVKIIKKNLQFALDHSKEEVLEREKHTQRYLGWSEDYAEGVKAFFEKRKPEFKGC